MSYIQGPIGSVGTVTSVGLSLPNIFNVTNSPVTNAGVLTATLNTETANTVFAGPISGAAATPTFRALEAADVPGSILPGGFTGFGTPSVTIGLTAKTGSATTAIATDSAPTLDQTAAWSFTGLGATNLLSASALSWNSDLFIVRDGANALAQRNGTTAQSFRVYNTFTDSSNYERGGLQYASNILQIGHFAAGTGTSGRTVQMWTGGAARWFYDTSNLTAALNIIFSGDANYNIGQSNNNRPANVFVHDSVTIGATPVILTGPGAATLQLGAAAADTTGVSQTLQAQGVTTGGTNNQAGGDFTVQSGQGKGTPGSKVVVKSPVAGVSGNTLQVMTRSHASINGSLIVGPGSALATTAVDGFIYVAGGAGPPTGTPTANTGAIALYYDITNDQLYAYNGAWKQPKTPLAAAIVNWQ
jgi:hypothetical protein